MRASLFHTHSIGGSTAGYARVQMLSAVVVIALVGSLIEVIKSAVKYSRTVRSVTHRLEKLTCVPYSYVPRKQFPRSILVTSLSATIVCVKLVEFRERHTDKRAALHRSRPPADQSGKRVASSTGTSPDTPDIPLLTILARMSRVSARMLQGNCSRWI